ncbi:MAG: ABC transporter permease [Caldilineaceae bacterium]|nr:ABC transporter permease [Caldilineaceae bacterium]
MTTATLRQRWFGSWAAPGSTAWYFRRDRMAMLSLIFLLLVLLGALFAPLLTPYPEQGRGEPNIAEKFQPPSLAHPLGTDALGRDMWARLLFGARTSLTVGLAVVALSALVGTLLGALAGYFGGWIDEVIMRITDIFLAFPPLLLAIVVATALGPSLRNMVLAIALSWWPWYTRIVRGQAVSLRERNFVEAARSMGVGDLTIIRRHILPNVLAPVGVQATLDLGAAILTAAGLSFLGLGTQPPTADWGVMVNEGRQYMLSGRWWIATFAGLAIFLTSMAFNLLGDGARDAADPRTRGGRT